MNHPFQSAASDHSEMGICAWAMSHVWRRHVTYDWVKQDRVMAHMKDFRRSEMFYSAIFFAQCEMEVWTFYL